MVLEKFNNVHLVNAMSYGVITMPAIDKEKQILRISEALEMLSTDNSIPRNIRKGASNAKKILMSTDKSMDVRIASTVMLLDELANDSNIPLHGRTAVWNIISQLEGLNKQ